MDITIKDFSRKVLQAKLPVLVEFWASWCPPCQAANSLLKEIKKEYQGKIKVLKVNIDKNPSLSSQYTVKSLPTFILFKKGKEIKREVGSRSKKQLASLITQ